MSEPASPAAPTGPAMVEGVDVDAIAKAVRACAGVSDLFAGTFGEFGSYLPGRRIAGVQVDDHGVTVQIKARIGHTPRDLFAQASGVTAALRHGRPLHLVIADIDDDRASEPLAVGSPDAIAPLAPLAITSSAESSTP